MKNISRFAGRVLMLIHDYRERVKHEENEIDDYQEGNSIDHETMMSRRSIWEDEGKKEGNQIKVTYSILFFLFFSNLRFFYFNIIILDNYFPNVI